MDYIWNQDDLWTLLQHHSDDVQAWAAMRLLELYPQTANELLRRLPQLKPHVASTILSYESHRGYPPELMTFFQQTSEPFLKADAAALLIRFGAALPDAQLQHVSLGDRFEYLADTASGFDFLHRCYHTPDDEAASLLAALALACHGADILQDFDDADERHERRALINRYGKAWDCDLTYLRTVRQPHQALRALQQALDAAATATAPDKPWKHGLCLALDENQRRLQAIAEAARTRLANVDDIDSEAETDFLVTCTMIAKRDAVCRAQLVEAQAVEDLWKAVVMRPWRLEVSPSLADFFRALEPERVLRALKQALDMPLTHVDAAFHLLTTLDTPGRFELFMTIFEDKSNRPRVNATGRALAAEAPLAARRILDHYRDHLPDPTDLMILAVMPTPDVEDFLLTHFDHYMCHPWSETFVETLEVIASKRFLEPLIAEWRPGELALSRVIAFIAAIHGVVDPRLQPIQQTCDEHHRQLEHLQQRAKAKPENAIQELLGGHAPFALPLRCTHCRRTYHYELQKIYLPSNRPEDIIVGQVVQCKGCGSIETYEFSPTALVPLSAEIFRFGLLAQLSKHQGQSGAPSQLPDTPLQPGRPQLMAHGRRFNTISEVYHHLKQELDQHPESAELHRRLGNVFKNGERSDLALPYYQRALELDPHESEASYNLVEVFVEQERYEEAIPHVETLIQYCREGEMEEDQRRHLLGWLIEHTALIQKQTEHRFELFPKPSKQETSPSDQDGEREPETVYFTSFDLTDADDFEDVYQVFRTGRVPETSRHSPQRIRKRARRPAAVIREPAHVHTAPVRTRQQKVGRNAPCPCGSGKKYKKCCGR
jgi:hypothetical protein